MNLCIDIGNTRSKLAIFDQHGHLVKLLYREKASPKIIEPILEKYSIQHAIVSSVRKKNGKLKRFLKKALKCFIFLSTKTKLPIDIQYATPKTLGRDRIAAVVGSRSILGKKNILVIDAGTCLTYDFINKKGKYLGGSILPGLSMRFQALHQLTSKLPLIQRTALDQLNFIGNSTETSIQTGVQLGIIHETYGFIQHYHQHYPNLQVVLTGGDTPYFETHLKNEIFAVPNLVLIGLNQILNYNVQ
ncbi:MAG: type III pantothenate kinase [Saprospiraceae bacterium]|nr:type III pantothenate kinase [Saprospiraceae bacterium]